MQKKDQGLWQTFMGLNFSLSNSTQLKQETQLQTKSQNTDKMQDGAGENAK